MQAAAYIGDIDEVIDAVEQLPPSTTETQRCQELLAGYDLESIDALARDWLSIKLAD